MAKTALEVNAKPTEAALDSMAITATDINLQILALTKNIPAENPPKRAAFSDWHDPYVTYPGERRITSDNATELEEILFHNCAIRLESSYTENIKKRIDAGDLERLYTEYPFAHRTIRIRCLARQPEAQNLRKRLATKEAYSFGDRLFTVQSCKEVREAFYTEKGDNGVDTLLEAEIELIPGAIVLE